MLLQIFLAVNFGELNDSKKRKIQKIFEKLLNAQMKKRQQKSSSSLTCKPAQPARLLGYPTSGQGLQI